MPFVSITRLRIRAIRFLPGLAVLAIRTRNQVLRAPGFRGGALLNDRAFALWTMTAWDDEASMRGYVLGGAHRIAMPRLVAWCDEASVVHWTQPEDALPSWEEADRRMRADGRPSRVRHPSPDHAGLTYRAPRLTGATPLGPSARAA